MNIFVIRLKSYAKVRKEVARRLFNEGYKVYVIPCKLNPFSQWDCAEAWNKELIDETRNAFDRTVIDYKNNVCNSEVGYYPNYYVLVQDYCDYHNKIKRMTSTFVDTGGIKSVT